MTKRKIEVLVESSDQPTTLDGRTWAPGHERYEHSSDIVEFWGNRKSVAGSRLERAPNELAAARTAIQTWWKAPDRLSFNLTGPGGTSTDLFRSCLEGAGLSPADAQSVVEEQISRRFGTRFVMRDELSAAA